MQEERPNVIQCTCSSIGNLTKSMVAIALFLKVAVASAVDLDQDFTSKVIKRYPMAKFTQFSLIFFFLLLQM